MIFAIETSCDETSVAILNFHGKLLSHIVVNQKNHHKFGGVVPEIASRAHLQILQSIIPKAFDEARIKAKDIDIFCATCGPGLIGGLLIGSTMAKSMSIGNNKPFYPINHLEGHILSPLLFNKINFPFLALLLTGGHTQIYLVEKIGNYKLLGETVDDAVGESFDKVAKLLGLGYPGGPLIEKKAVNGNVNSFKLPHPLEFKKTLSFSFSGIKTAVSLLIKEQNKIDEKIIIDIAASFQNKIIEILKKRTILALTMLKNKGYNIKDVAIVGGVAANKIINKSFKQLCKENNCRFVFPPQDMCGDNAAMIAWACLQKYKKNIKPDLHFKEDPRWSLSKIFDL
tara:strand:+ start:301 stop:1323 length:1023 start_codon:yes stop_codon:yes gene_type:complete